MLIQHEGVKVPVGYVLKLDGGVHYHYHSSDSSTCWSEGVCIEIASSDLDDPEAMKRHLKRISMKLRLRLR